MRQFGRVIGKLSHCNPTIACMELLSKIQVHDNFIMLIVDALKYLSSLTFDVLVCASFCRAATIAHAHRTRRRGSGTSLDVHCASCAQGVSAESSFVSRRLRSLAQFVGALFRKHSNTQYLELIGVLQYIMNQLRADQPLTLLVLEELIRCMAGINPAPDLSSDLEIDALAGGEILRYEVRRTRSTPAPACCPLSDRGLLRSCAPGSRPAIRCATSRRPVSGCWMQCNDPTWRFRSAFNWRGSGRLRCSVIATTASPMALPWTLRSSSSAAYTTR